MECSKSASASLKVVHHGQCDDRQFTPFHTHTWVERLLSHVTLCRSMCGNRLKARDPRAEIPAVKKTNSDPSYQLALLFRLLPSDHVNWPKGNRVEDETISTLAAMS